MVAAASLEHDLNSRIALLCFLLTAPLSAFAELHVVIVEGLGGDPLYAQQFSAQVDAIEAAASSLTADNRIHTFRGNAASRDAIVEHLENLRDGIGANDQLNVFLVGHGSYDDVEYKFNLPGPDLTGTDIAAILDSIASTRQLLVITGSSSGALHELASKDERIIILATRSGTERHATRFGNFFATALSDSAADIDKNNLISVAEAFDYAARQVADYYENNGQLATEHPRIEGENTNRVSLARLVAARANIVSVAAASLIADRDALNAEIDALRLGRDDMQLQDYQAQLLEKLLELARIEDAIEAQQGNRGED